MGLEQGVHKPSIADSAQHAQALVLEHATLGKRWFFHDTNAATGSLPTTRRTIAKRSDAQSPTRYTKDGIDRYIVGGDTHAIDPRVSAPKRRLHYRVNDRSGARRKQIRLRLTDLRR